MKQMTKIEIIDETIEYYENNPRSIDVSQYGTSCMYLGPNGENCGFSRCCKQETVEKLHKENEGYGIHDFMLDYLKEQYTGHNTEFWTNIQMLHDTGSYWKNNKLTTSGKAFVKTLKEQYD